MTEQELNIIIFNKNDNLESYNLNPGIDETSNNEKFVSSFDHTSYKNKLDKYNQEIKNASEDSVYKERRDKVIQNRMEMINDDTITKIKTYIQEYCPNITLEEPIDGIEAKIQHNNNNHNHLHWLTFHLILQHNNLLLLLLMLIIKKEKRI